MLAIYNDRPPLECSQPYCYFRSPAKFLESFAMEQSSYLICIIGMLAYFFVLRFAGYFLLRSKLKTIRWFFLEVYAVQLTEYKRSTGTIVSVFMF